MSYGLTLCTNLDEGFKGGEGVYSWIVLPFELNVKVEMAGRAWVGKDNQELSS